MKIPTEIYLAEFDYGPKGSFHVKSISLEDEIIFGKNFSLNLDELRNCYYGKEWIENLTLKELIDNFVFDSYEEADKRLDEIIDAQAALREREENERMKNDT